MLEYLSNCSRYKEIVMRKGLTLSHLSDMIHKKLNTVGQDIEHDYHPACDVARKYTLLSIIVLLANKDKLCTRPDSTDKRYQPLFDNEFYELVEFIADDIDKYGYLSFYHILGLLTALSYHYADIVAKRKYKTVGLNNIENWSEPTFDMAVSTIFYAAGRLFQKPLNEHSAMFTENDVTIFEMISYVRYHINKLH